jgi:hypothetical protein
MSGHKLDSATAAMTFQERAGTKHNEAGQRLKSTKIHDWHLDRLAVVYVRQSSPHQVLHHRESRERQYALVHRAIALGWSRERVLVIDED